MVETLDELKGILADDPSPEAARQEWSAFIEGKVVNFFNKNKIEKLAIEDGNGNKAKLVRTKDNEIRTEYSSVVML
ncbi:MAG: hypothetical protein LBJ95_03425 [Oscillospiraceae bacterium]|jgi:hypothetical protein|nr:hypothetical protein [Oscillospiraceae bacterium]